MYLKRLEMAGFKSFAERTRLDFDPGLMAIVGPNGCGKSNISDGIRWVLGEQSAKALRGGKMEDVIFNGTDHQKAMGMAEVTLTLADCEPVLGTEFNEVTVTRRVYRSGDSQYLINKTPCRLKDIQRLFMDTGIGTTSYSVMEQGRIDRVLSSRPEDRREVFEEASGITKYKSDKREAIRKLEHTEANLVRLGDIIREVKSRIISLQRQAGKARRYQSLMEQLRSLDLYHTRGRVESLDRDVRQSEARLAMFAEREEAMAADSESSERNNAALREELAAIDHEMTQTFEQVMQTRTELDRTLETIRSNEERIRDITEIARRENQEAEQSRATLARQHELLAQAEQGCEAARVERETMRVQFSERSAALREVEDRLEALGQLRQKLQNEAIEIDRQMSNLQRELNDIDARDHKAAFHREKLAADQVQLQRSIEQFEARRREMEHRIGELKSETRRREEALTVWQQKRREKATAIGATRQRLSELRAQLAARRARLEMLSRSEAEAEGFPGGARLLLDESRPVDWNRGALVGSLASSLVVEPDYRAAVEAALRPWLDALVVRDAAQGLAALKALARARAGSARLLAADGADEASPDSPVGEPLSARVTAPDESAAVVRRLLNRVFVVAAATDIPSPVPADLVFVTKDGLLAGGRGVFEIWMPEARESNPVARRQLLNQWTAECEQTERDLQSAQAELDMLSQDDEEFQRELEQERRELETRRSDLAHALGVKQSADHQERQARDRLETVRMELDSLGEQSTGSQDRKARIHEEKDRLQNRQAAIRGTLSEKVEEQRVVEQDRSRRMNEVTECRIALASADNQARNAEQRREQALERIAELEAVIQDRLSGASSHLSRIGDLERSTAAARDSIEPLRAEVSLLQQRHEEAKRRRDERAAALKASDQALHDLRQQLDGVRRDKNHLEIELAEMRLRRQNLVERAAQDYRVAPEAVMDAPKPDWGGEPVPEDREAIETSIAEMKAKIEAMGPVNLVAIEEHQELEERYNFLSQQQDDLLKSKQQLMDLIKKINTTTTELFSNTFKAVNENFDRMFRKLFGGGSARLVLVDEADVLESGIEIIARPPGKKLQTVSLLSGGERTMTAVALLFALFMVKPSPFCVLDELDAALDDSNIGRFVQVVKDFLSTSQFVVITHNRQTIAAAHALFGITMEKHGISKVVSVRFNEQKAAESGRAEVVRLAADSPEAVAIAAESAADSPGAPGADPV